MCRSRRVVAVSARRSRTSPRIDTSTVKQGHADTRDSDRLGTHRRPGAAASSRSRPAADCRYGRPFTGRLNGSNGSTVSKGARAHLAASP